MHLLWKNDMKINQIIEDIKKSDIENVFFGDLKGSSEKDTDVEAELYKIVAYYIGNSDDADRGRMVKIFNDLQRLKPYFPNDLKPDAEYAYRGTKVMSSIYQSIYDDVVLDRGTDINRNHGWFYHYFDYKSRALLQSWTTDLNVAEDFSGRDFRNFHDSVPSLPAIVKVDVDDDFILSTKITNLINDREFGMDDFEYEIFRISNKPIKAMLFIRPRWLKSWATIKGLINGSQ